MIDLPLMVRRYPTGESRLWGIYSFANVPRIGERITFESKHLGWCIVLKVSDVNHEPLRVGETPLSNSNQDGDIDPTRYDLWIFADYVTGPPEFDTEGDLHGPAHAYWPEK